MDTKDVKRIFYNRYGSSKNFLHLTHKGCLCPLLGHYEISGAASVGCELSMGIAMLARRLDGSMVKLSDADSDRQLTYVKNTPPSLYFGRARDTAMLIGAAMSEGCGGAEIVFKSSAPSFAKSDTEFRLALITSMFKTSGIKKDKLDTAHLASDGDSVDAYIALSYAQNGSAVLCGMGEPKILPMALHGYKIITAYIAQKDIDRAAPVQNALQFIRQKYPSASPSAVTDEQIEYASKKREHRAAALYLRHVRDENNRIRSISKNFNTERLLDVMNISQKSMEGLWNLCEEHRFLAKCARNVDGARAVRCFPCGAVIVAREDMLSHVISAAGSEFENSIGYRPSFCISTTEYE